MRRQIEREVKLSPGSGFRLQELGGEQLPTRVFVSTYHDTPDLRLARHSVTFRHRLEDGTGLWQLKLPRGAARIELEEPGPPARPPQAMLDLLPAYLRGEELVPIARLRTRRDVVHLDGAEVVEDSVAVLDAQYVARRFRELEIELLDGDERTLRRLEKALRRAGAESDVDRPKLYRALDLALPEELEPLPPGATPGEEIAHAFAENYRRILYHDPGTRLGVDPEDLHQLRVATRRLRAFLRGGLPLLDRAWAESLRAELGWLGSTLGPARDLDVLVEHLREEVESLGPDAAAARGLLESFDEEREAARAAVVEALSTDRYLRLLDRLDAAADSPRLSGEEVALASLWWKEWKRAVQAFEALDEDPPDAELHAARIDVKRARYAAELASAELGRRGEAFVEAAKRLQDVLGEHQDAVVAEARIRDWADGAPEGRLAAGRLVQLERSRRAAARADWPAAWARLERRARKARR
jgi:CHAD domain-containing protein